MMSVFLAAEVRNSLPCLVQIASELQSPPFWRPLGKGRNAYSQIIECARLCEYLTETLRSRVAPGKDWLDWQAVETLHPTLDAASRYLALSGETLAQTVEAFPAELWETTLSFPFKPDRGKDTFANHVLWVVWNNHYHTGQLHYIQQLENAIILETPTAAGGPA